jgi:hypothetical protein
MSLLLDALKKAADDKQKASQSETVSTEATVVQTGLQEEVQIFEESAYRTQLATENETSSDETSNFSQAFSPEIL